jgi:hypothetical protein
MVGRRASRLRLAWLDGAGGSVVESIPLEPETLYLPGSLARRAAGKPVAALLIFVPVFSVLAE